MIEPTKEDIGRSVVYTRNRMHDEGHAKQHDQGVIKSFNDFYVFVRYGDSPHSLATLRRDLEWMEPEH